MTATSRALVAAAMAGSAACAQPPVAGDSGPRAPVRATTSCTVLRIVDGDTFRCRGDTVNVRLIGIDPPEGAQLPMGPQATAALTAMIPAGNVVQLERDVVARDQYGRMLAYVWANGRLVNWRMVREGWALVYTIAPNVQYVDSLVAAQARSRADKKGFWATNGFACAPADYRSGKCR
jgi:micrococcal nuclease